ncbi:MAG: aminopeptidase [Candidatus Thermoplasmatota archaeon]
MENSAINVLSSVLNMNEGDRVLVITDAGKIDIAEAFVKGAEELKASETKIYILHNKRPIKKVDTLLKKTISENWGIIINAFEGYEDETPFRIKLLKKEIGTNARVGHAPGITKEMLFNGSLSADYKKIRKNAEELIKILSNAKGLKIETNKGTDIYLDIDSRGFQTDVYIQPGKFGNLPAGEIWCAPNEKLANGTIVVDGSIGDIGQVKKELKIFVKDGKIKNLESDDKELVNRIKKLVAIDKMASVIGELGIGLNPNARISGNLLEDEKALKTAHIAFGNNEEMQGGKNNSKTHRDFLFHNPTIEVEYGDGSKKAIMINGLLLI